MKTTSRNAPTTLANGELSNWRSHVVRLVACSVLPLALVACGTTGRSFPPAPQAVDAPSLRYKIGPLDTLNVVVWRNPELSAIVTVRPDGFVSIPLVEDLQAAGRNPSDLSREIEKSLAKLIRDPVVSVVVTSFQGIYSEQVRIVGEAAKIGRAHV